MSALILSVAHRNAKKSILFACTMSCVSQHSRLQCIWSLSRQMLSLSRSFFQSNGRSLPLRNFDTVTDGNRIVYAWLRVNADSKHFEVVNSSIFPFYNINNSPRSDFTLEKLTNLGNFLVITFKTTFMINKIILNRSYFSLLWFSKLNLINLNF